MGGQPSRSARFARGLTRSAAGQRTSQATTLAESSESCTEHTEQGQRLVSWFKRLIVKINKFYDTF